MYIKWLKFVIRKVYKMFEISYTKRIQNGLNSLYEKCTKWLTFVIRDVYKMDEIRYTRSVQNG